jgi:peptidoglycan-N-acetylglucosamine deacetylase
VASTKVLIALIIFAFAVLLLVLVFLWPYKLIPLFKSIYPSVIWDHGTSKRVVALTFDDGPDPVYTPKILDELRRWNTKATFFVIGERAEAFPGLINRICAEGHELGNHSATRNRTIALTAEHFKKDLLRAEAQIMQVPCAVRMFRPAGIWLRKSQLVVLERLHYKCVLGSAYGHDPLRPPARYIAWVLSRGLRNGAILVLHDSGGDRSRTLVALPRILESAEQKGFRVTRVSDLLRDCSGA